MDKKLKEYLSKIISFEKSIMVREKTCAEMRSEIASLKSERSSQQKQLANFQSNKDAIIQRCSAAKPLSIQPPEPQPSRISISQAEIDSKISETDIQDYISRHFDKKKLDSMINEEKTACAKGKQRDLICLPDDVKKNFKKDNPSFFSLISDIDILGFLGDLDLLGVFLGILVSLLGICGLWFLVNTFCPTDTFDGLLSKGILMILSVPLGPLFSLAILTLIAGLFCRIKNEIRYRFDTKRAIKNRRADIISSYDRKCKEKCDKLRKNYNDELRSDAKRELGKLIREKLEKQEEERRKQAEREAEREAEDRRRQAEREAEERKKQAEKRYARELTVMKKTTQSVVVSNSTQCQVINNTINELSDGIQKTRDTLEKMYQKCRIPKEFRGIAAISNILYYLDTGMSPARDGLGGAYRMYREEKYREANLALLSNIVERLDQIHWDNVEMRVSMNDVSDQVKNLSSSVTAFAAAVDQKMSDMQYAIEEQNAAINAQNAAIYAQNVISDADSAAFETQIQARNAAVDQYAERLMAQNEAIQYNQRCANENLEAIRWIETFSLIDD